MTGKTRPRTTTDALEILHHLLYEGRPDQQAALEEARRESDVAEKVYAMRKAAGLTQKKLAQLVKTSPSVISRLEDADYGKHSLGMLDRVAAALGRSVRVEFPEAAPSPSSWDDLFPKTGAQAAQASLWQEFATASSGMSGRQVIDRDDLQDAA